MSVLLMKALWFRVNEPDVTINLTDAIDMNIGRGIDIKNNIAIINLTNPAVSLDSTGTAVKKYIDTTGNIKFEEQDQIKIYLKYTDDDADLESDEWDVTKPNKPDSTYLKGVYYVIEFNVQDNIKGSPIKLKTADKSYILFSKLLARAFLTTEGLTSPTAVQKVVRFATQNQNGFFKGTGDDPGALYDVDARLTTETLGGDGTGTAGHIQAARKTTTEQGGVNSDTDFPVVSLAKVWKPVYEWINELSQLEFLNTDNELTNTSAIVYGRPFLYYVDEQNEFHWFETDNTVAKGNTITIGTTTGIYNYKLDKKVFDTVNFIIFRGGEDMFGKGTLNYYVDDTSNLKTKRMRVISMVDIADKLIKKEIDLGNLILDNTQTVFTYSGNNYKADTYGFTTGWGIDTTGFSDSDYNDALKSKIELDGRARCRSLYKGLSSARYKGQIIRKGSIVTVGSLLDITNQNTGQNSELLRIMDVRDTITKNGWVTSMQIEQDQEAIIEGDVTK